MKVRKSEQAPGSKTTVTVNSFDYFIGELFQHCELLGLTDRQLNANKVTLRKLCWTWYNSHLDNPNGLSDPSRQARIEAGIEPNTTSSTGHIQYNVTV